MKEEMKTTCGRKFSVLPIAFILLFAITSTGIADTIIYVDGDATGANDGSSWANAYKYLQDALAKASSWRKPLKIHVAQGTYRPDEDTLHPNGTGDRQATFQLINGVTLKGSYAGFGEPEPNVWNPDVYKAILSGDLDENDKLNFRYNNDNCYHVVTGIAVDSTAVLDGFTISAGNADTRPSPGSIGGGMLNHNASPTVLNCAFVANSGVSGGGMYNWEGSEVRLIDCSFIGNSVSGYGAGIYNNASSPEIVNCRFSNNLADYNGGGIQNRSSSNPTLNNCTFSSNTAHRGGAISNYDYSIPLLTNCTLSENTADYGGGMHNSENCTAVIRNCILWGDIPEEIYVYGQAPVVTFSNVQGGWAGEGNLDRNPRFMDTLGGDIHLLPDSPCVNTGDPGFVVGADAVDIDGEKRVMLERVDMGADEFNPFSAEFVVVRRERLDRAVFEYECEVVLQNISRFAVSLVSLKMAEWSENMTIIEPNISFAGAEIGPGESATSVDTCTFTVDRSEAIDPAGIIWHVTAEMAKTGARIESTLSSPLPLTPPLNADLGSLKEIAENWLWQGTAGGIGMDTVQDGTVNLADFAKFAEHWRKK